MKQIGSQKVTREKASAVNNTCKVTWWGKDVGVGCDGSKVQTTFIHLFSEEPLNTKFQTQRGVKN